MPVYNALPHLDAAVESILRQNFTDFEFVILDDGSTDGSTERLRYWAARDQRIRLIESSLNQGPAISSEKVARAAVAPLVARMDADDISYPSRLAEQLELLEAHPEVGLVGALCDVVNSEGRMIRGPEAWRLARDNWFVPFPHGVITYRKRVFEKVGGYRKECVFWEDQDLIVRMSQAAKVLVVPHALYQVRQSTTSTRMASQQERLERAVDLMYRSVKRLEDGRGYDDLLELPASEEAKLDPRVFISLGSVLLWSGNRPRLFARCLRRARLRLDFRSISTLVWTAWASLSPASLRLFLRVLLVLRNRYGAIKMRPDRPVYWHPAASGSG